MNIGGAFTGLTGAIRTGEPPAAAKPAASPPTLRANATCVSTCSAASRCG